MKLSEYLKLRGGNNLTNAEARAIGILLIPGWPAIYAAKDVPDHLAKEIVRTKNIPWNSARKRLKKTANLKLEKPENGEDIL